MVSNEKKILDDKISRAFADSETITRILQTGIRLELLKHKQAGKPVCEWRDNKVVWISPEHIPIKQNKAL